MDWFGKSKLWKNKLKPDNNPSIENPNQNIGKKLIENEQYFKNTFQNCSDIIYREITIHGQIKLLMIYVDGMIDTNIIISNVLKPLMYNGLPQGLGTIDSIAQMFEQELFSVLQTKKLSNFGDIAELILKGNVALLVDGETSALLADVKMFESRAVEESANEAALRGSRESFTEKLRTNTTMLRRILATPKLKMESFKVGKLTNTDVVLTYIDGIVTLSVLNEVRKRINQIQIDGILESGYIEESIEDTRYTPFPQMLNTERPDVVAAGLLEGKVGILTNGTPFALVVPMTFWGGLQAPDDYYERFLFVTLNRWIRYLFSIFSVYFPSIYIALTNFHPEMVPPDLMLNIATLREKAPFPTVIEVFMMEFMFEGLREAGIRLPKQIGPLVSVVGALVIGEAAVRAGIISAPIVIVVSAAGISSFVIPRYRFSFPLRMLRFPLLILSGMFGLFGIAVGIIAIIIHLIHLSPFGTPYLTPLAPLVTHRFKDVFLRWPRGLAKDAEPKNEADPT
jgi:spore germination protein